MLLSLIVHKKLLKVRRKLAGQSVGNDDEVSIICFRHKYCTGGLVRSEKEATILYSVEKRLYFTA